jgi:prepilin-type N-terminal cleavage/methylation domain-containing protein
MHTIHHPRRGFTLVEIVIILCIVALLASIAIPNYLRVTRTRAATEVVKKHPNVHEGSIEVKESSSGGAIVEFYFIGEPQSQQKPHVAILKDGVIATIDDAPLVPTQLAATVPPPAPPAKKPVPDPYLLRKQE